MRVLLCTSTSAATTTVRVLRRRLRGTIRVASLGFDQHADRPNESEQLAGDCGHDLRLILAAREHALESPMQAMLRFSTRSGGPRDSDRRAVCGARDDSGPPAISPSGFDD